VQPHTLGVPCLTLREHTERPATITSGTNEPVKLDPAAVAGRVRALLDRGRPSRTVPPLSLQPLLLSRGGRQPENVLWQRRRAHPLMELSRSPSRSTSLANEGGSSMNSSAMSL
jgi:hypothetical protein